MSELSTFCCESRILLRDGLLSLYNGVLERKEPLLVSLEAPSGWGKTRVGREFYACLAADQPEPRYWPDEIEDPDQGRKAVRPPFVTESAGSLPVFPRPPDSLPVFFWWGIACSARNGSATSMLRVDLDQLDCHEFFLEQTRKKLVSSRSSLGPKLVQAGKALVADGTQQLTGRALGMVAEEAVPLLGISIRLARLGLRTRREHNQIKAAVAESSTRGGSASDIVDESVTLLAQLSEPGLPIIIFVEDIHKSDDMLLELLDKLLRVKSPILMISTTLPDQIDTNRNLKNLLLTHSDRVHRVGHTEEAGEPFAPGAGLTDFDEQGRKTIVSDYYPEHRQDTLQALMDRYTNPLALEMACQLLKRRHPGERLDAGPEITDRLPRDLSKLYLKIWDEIPKETQLALAVSHIITPANIALGSSRNAEDRPHNGIQDSSSRRASRENRWTQSVLHDVIENLDLPDREEVILAMVAAPHAYAWVRIIDDYLRSFAESIQSDIANEDGAKLLDDELDTSNARQEILNTLARVLSTDHHRNAGVNTAQTILVLHAEGYLTDLETVADAFEAILSELQDSPRELPERIRLCEDFLGLNHQQVSTETLYRMRDHRADALASSGKIRAAIAAYEELLDDRLQELGAEHPDTLGTRINLAFWLGKSGRVDEAITAFEELLEDELRVLGAEHADTFTTRDYLARMLGEAGRVDEAVTAFEELLNDERRVLGAEHPHTLNSRGGFINWLGAAGRVDEAINASRALLDDELRVFGAEHPETFDTRSGLANWLGEAGRVEEAITAYETLLDDRLHWFGADHPDTLTTRSSLARWLGEAGRVEEAITAYETLLDDRLRVLGAEHSDVLATRHNLARLLGDAGHVDEAITAYETLLEDVLRVLGADHPNTLITRGNLAGLLATAGRVDEAISAYETIFDDELRVLGAEHPNTLATRSHLASWLGKKGQVDEAITAYEALLHDEVRVRGADHPGTTTTRSHLAYWLTQAGRIDEAITAYETLLDDRVRVLGAEHASTLDTRSHLAYWLTQAGRIDEAIAAYEALLHDETQVRGAEHPSTVTTRSNLQFLARQQRP